MQTALRLGVKQSPKCAGCTTRPHQLCLGDQECGLVHHTHATGSDYCGAPPAPFCTVPWLRTHPAEAAADPLHQRLDSRFYTIHGGAVEEILELLAYQLTILKASQQYDGLYWRAYDTHYRVNAAATGNRLWSRLDTDLYTRRGRGVAVPGVWACMYIIHMQHIWLASGLYSRTAWCLFHLQSNCHLPCHYRDVVAIEMEGIATLHCAHVKHLYQAAIFVTCVSQTITTQ